MNIAVVGLGFMGATHARAWSLVPGATLYAVVSRNETKWTGDLTQAGGNLATPAVRLDFSQVRKFHTLAEALADPAVEAVDLCLPTDQHAATAISALRAGKHVLVEKPLALDSASAEQVAREAESSGRVLMAAHVLRFMSPYVIARERLAGLGPVRHAAFRRRCAAPAWSAWLGDPARSGGGAFDLLIHDADFVRWVFGMPLDLQSGGAVDPARGIDLVTAILRYPDASVTIAGGWHGQNAFPFSMDFTIACRNGALEFCCGTLLQFAEGMGPETICLPDSDPFVTQCAHFHQCALSGTPSAICPVHESVDAVRLMESILHQRSRGDA